MRQLTLLAYEYDEHRSKLTLLALGNHENFYRDAKLFANLLESVIFFQSHVVTNGVTYSILPGFSAF